MNLSEAIFALGRATPASGPPREAYDLLCREARRAGNLDALLGDAEDALDVAEARWSSWDEDVRRQIAALHDEAHGEEKTDFRFCRHEVCRRLVEEIGPPDVPVAFSASA